MEYRSIVTGCCGFIGSHMCRKLLSEGYIVLGIDSLVSGSLENISDIITNKNFCISTLNICDSKVIDIVNGFKPDIIYNFACIGSPKVYLEHKLETFKTNTIGIENIITATSISNAKLFHASSSEVYGDASVYPQTESYYGNVNTFSEYSCYTESKRAAESILSIYSKMYDIKIYVGRLFNIYGSMPLYDKRVISSFINSAIVDEPIIIYGTGENIRCFCYIDDALSAITSLVETDYHYPVNIGNNEPITMYRLSEKIIDLANSKSKIIMTNKRSYDPAHREPDIKLIKTLTGWEPKISLEEGLINSIEKRRIVGK